MWVPFWQFDALRMSFGTNWVSFGIKWLPFLCHLDASGCPLGPLSLELDLQRIRCNSGPNVVLLLWFWVFPNHFEVFWIFSRARYGVHFRSLYTKLGYNYISIFIWEDSTRSPRWVGVLIPVSIRSINNPINGRNVGYAWATFCVLFDTTSLHCACLFFFGQTQIAVTSLARVLMPLRFYDFRSTSIVFNSFMKFSEFQ